jgi:hypothetical protein
MTEDHDNKGAIVPAVLMKEAERLRGIIMDTLDKSRMERWAREGEVDRIDAALDLAEKLYVDILEINRKVSVGMTTAAVKARLDYVHDKLLDYEDIALTRHYPGDVMPYGG